MLTKWLHVGHNSLPVYMYVHACLQNHNNVGETIRDKYLQVPRPQALPKNWEKGLVTLPIFPVPECALSAVSVWSRGITFVHYQLLHS